MLLRSAHMVTLEEGLEDPARFIRYEMSEFNRGLNALFALLMLYGMLSTLVSFVVLVSRALGYRRKRDA